MERNNRAGARYTEFLGAHFGVHRDDRLQRPEYIGGSKTPVIISEVLQTSQTDATSPQGNLAGHGIAVSDAFCGKYKAEEFGLIIGIMSVMPRPRISRGLIGSGYGVLCTISIFLSSPTCLNRLSKMQRFARQRQNRTIKAFLGIKVDTMRCGQNLR